jgi:CheY-like chemotaxis protein
MLTFEAFRDHLQATLNHLYDPCHQPHPSLWMPTGVDPQQKIESLRNALIQRIESLKPDKDVPESTRSWRIYHVLTLRYVQNLTQAEAAERLNITPRHLRREQKSAVNVLAERLWTDKENASSGRGTYASPPAGAGSQDPGECAAPSTRESEGWRDQLQEELAVLQDGSTRSIADVNRTMQRAIESTRTLTSQQKTEVIVEPPTEGTMAAINPSALRQIMIIAICKLTKLIDGGAITLRSHHDTDRIRISITGTPVLPGIQPNSEFIQEMVTLAKDGSVEIVTENRHVAVTVQIPAVTMTRVLVIDDNQDLVHFFNRYTTGTRYQIVSAVTEAEIFDLIDRAPPDVIVLDVMLPEVDGWELLAHLHAYPATRETPIILCSVIREEELALALGATRYLPKPVHRQDFIQALDAATSQAAPSQAAPSQAASYSATAESTKKPAT